MAGRYNTKRGTDWNFGGKKWKLSRSKLDLFIECPKCFYLDNKLGLRRPPSYPYNLNTAVDTLLKKEFDVHRAKDRKHPLQEEYGIDAKPVAHEELNAWRDNFEGVTYEHPKTGMTISGAIDDLWINSKGEYIVVDYKSTSKNEQITALDKDWQDSYKRQMEVYQWLLRKKGYTVSDTGYFIYANGITDKKAFDGKLEFDVTLIPYEGNDSWVEKAVFDAYDCLQKDSIPNASQDCDYCSYRGAVLKIEKKEGKK